ncbi:LacI family DNA-binding transcriptional regulator [Ahrensia sp. R2A130]|uniref:LacI family DNA-binding transcriptional regulator n=1 Tax=Ahrensia sp. R2A130 TaxID=744979 RepID=UPI0001E0C9F4|nr:LacI family DNA-binding transcriptional regulator [Ahrensia sp. R2A130]EFL89414.1 LacI family transcription regulator [Ahrensia sp. R2A130]
MTAKHDKRSNVNLAEVAEAAGVSKMTASRVMRNVSGFSEDTREKVLREASRLGYVPNRIAAAFGSEQTSSIIGVSVPYLSSNLFGAVLDSTNDALAKLGYQTMIGAHENSAQTEEVWIRNILSWRPAGLILSGHTHTKNTRELLKAHGVPVAEIWNLNTSPIDMSVGFNHFDSGQEMGLYILSKGYRRIGYVGAEAAAPGLGTLRRKGFLSALAGAGIQCASEEILNDRAGFYAGFYGTENILARDQNLDAIYYQDDAMAIGGIFYCQAQGMNVPGDIGIAGWGSMEAASILPQRLTTTVVSTQALGKTAAEALIARIRGEAVEDVTITPTRLVPGNTI